MRKKWSVVVLALALSACGDASSINTTPSAQTPETLDTSPVETTKEPTTTKTEARARVGSTISLAGEKDGVEVDGTLVKVVDPAPAGQFLDPEGRLVAIQIKITNTGTELYEDSPSNGRS